MPEKITWSSHPKEEVARGMIRKMIYGEKIMICHLSFKDGFEVPMHSHHNEQITQVLKGTIRFWFGENKEEELDVHAGESVVIPPHLPHAALIIGEVEASDTFSPPRQDWIEGSDDYLRK
ncbi:MAG: cupin domain-containing protein [Bacteroidota bacterium]